jgi:mono/diheme cytochrome c family protein
MRRRTTEAIAIHSRYWSVVVARRHFHLLMGVTLGVFLIVLGSALARASAPAAQTKERTTRDKVYSKEQAARGAAQFGKVCAPCHDASKKTPDKTPGPPLVGTGSMFVENWKDHTIGEIFTTILTTMPNDGSVVLTESDTVDLVAHLLQSNGYPEGPEALKFDAAAKAIKVVPVK